MLKFLLNQNLYKTLENTRFMLNRSISLNLLKISCSLFAFLLWQSCNIKEESKTELFERYVQQFKEVELPIDTDLLYRVHNNKDIGGRIDTTFIQKFIKADYKLRADMPVYNGYAYGYRLPREGNNYESLIYYHSKNREQFFILSTYSLEGEPLSSLPISGDSSSYKRVTAQIDESRMILLKEAILNQPDSGFKEIILEITEKGEINKLDEFSE